MKKTKKKLGIEKTRRDLRKKNNWKEKEE